ncbi:ubiquitin-like domain-containing protein [Streptomyces sp. TRM 70361]|uniref:ubiquitin-like domain-containing protein n=1 Tax=Streptomyces sp. TRM 70361 TaxID=3116553 RepID=UPI002E7B3B68|nr:ubiquitin-like domain-containing protein [Streptomyces sp. TRM 70361]MEE1938479.1 ubiquitin-like domain-containing protein [Streptomyces sp. TRM 70361]
MSHPQETLPYEHGYGYEPAYPATSPYQPWDQSWDQQWDQPWETRAWEAADPRPPSYGEYGPGYEYVPPPADPYVPPPYVPPPAGGRAGGRRGRRAAHARRRAGRRPAALRALLPRALVLAFLTGGTTAFLAHDKAVELTVEGERRTLHTFAGDVAGLLADEGVELGEHDAVSPAPGTALAHGDRVTVRRARPLALTVDGRERRVWTTAPTVAWALRRLGVRPEGAYLSVPGDRPIGRGGLALRVRTERTVTFLADGREHTVRTNAATVREAMAEAGIGLRRACGDGVRCADRVSAPLDSFPREGQTVTVRRVTDTTEVHEEPVPYRTVRRPDPALPRGTEVVERPGRAGLRRITREVRAVDGVRQRPRRTAAAVVREPEPRVIRVGTAEPRAERGADGLDWAALARCESGGRPDAVDPTGTYGGLYQFDTRTWRRLGGTGRPQDAPPAEQTRLAKKLYVRQGAAPWPVCGRKLHR